MMIISMVDTSEGHIVGEAYSGLIDPDNIFFVTEGKTFNSIVLMNPVTGECHTICTLTSMRDIYKATYE